MMLYGIPDNVIILLGYDWLNYNIIIQEIDSSTL